MYIFSFEKLDVWQDTKDLCLSIYKATKPFPDDEKFGITSQMRRAAISVSSNIAEGSPRTSKKDQANFYKIAFSSLMELLSQLIISQELEYITNETYLSLRSEIEKIANKLNAIRKSCLNT